MGRPSRTLLLAVAASLSTLASAHASDRVVLDVSQSRYFVLPGAAASVVVGDPAVADVTVLSAHSVVISAKKYGGTEVMAFDHGGRLLLDKAVMVAPGDTGRLTLHRGVAATEFACSNGCVALSTETAAAAAAPTTMDVSAPVTVSQSPHP